MIVEIVILAMIAAFLGLRLYSVLGRRAEHEEEPVPTRFDTGSPKNVTPLAPVAAARTAPVPAQAQLAGEPLVPAIERGVREIAAADRRFDITSFVEGARGAYAMTLEAFWQGDRETLRLLCDDDVYAGFAAAIDAREAAGEVLDNRLVRIEDVRLDAARLDGRTARVAVRFVADIAAVTRNKDGVVIAGSLDDAIETRDVWTFKRDIDAPGPDWLLDETDQD